MPTIPKCEKCERKNGYAKDGNDKICARCAHTEESNETNTPHQD